jgi:serine/threonine protein kinase
LEAWEIKKKKSNKIGKYQITSKIGQGGMASVYLAYDPLMERNVAIKVPSSQSLHDQDAILKLKERFYNEIRLNSKLENKYILRAYDANESGSLIYLTMEYVKEGKTLDDYCLKDDLLPIPQAVGILYKCCKGIDYLHSKKILHRDIKPGNVLITEDYDVKIADFGIAMIMDGQVERPRQNNAAKTGASVAANNNNSKADDFAVTALMNAQAEKTMQINDDQATGAQAEDSIYENLGTPLYMGPERFKNNATPHYNWDLFSLGVVMYKMLTGEYPFYGKDLDGLRKSIEKEEPPLMSKHREGVPEELESIVKKALLKNPLGRYQNGNEFATDLLRVLKQLIYVEDVSDISVQEKLKDMKNLKFFDTFFDKELLEVIKASEWLTFENGQDIIRENEEDYSFYIIVKGDVEVIKGENVLAELSAGECFGEMGFIRKVKRTAGTRAANDVSILKINGTLIESSSMGCQLKFMKKFLYTLIERLSMANTRMTQQG